MWTRRSNICAGCGKMLRPFSTSVFTAHEYKCYKAHPDKIPSEDKEIFEQTVLGEKRSLSAKKGVETRRRKQGKRAPRPL